MTDREIAALGEQYEVIRPLGRGGMGSVFLARERLLDRLVAIKVLHSDTSTEESRERFVREARTAAKLTHPNIVPLYSFGQSGDTVYYVMGYVEGESLEASLRRVGRLSPDEASNIIGQLAAALEYAHGQGVVHRDIKPDNILIERGTGRAVLADFGIAKLQSASGLTATGIIVGTPHYMSPEQASGERTVDGRSDLYSLGVVAYRMLVGRLPFDGASAQEVIAQHLSRRPPSVASVAPLVSTSLASAVTRALEKNPADRWPNAGDFRQAIAASEADPLTMPEGLEHLPGHGTNLGLALWVIESLVIGLHAAQPTKHWDVLIYGTPVLFALAPLPSIVVGKRAGMSFGRIVRLMFAPVAPWSGWWPASLRRPGDVWARLPVEVRRARGLLTLVAPAMLIAIPLFIPIWIAAIKNPDFGVELGLLKHVLSYFFAPLFAGFGGLTLWARRWGARYGLRGRDANRMLVEQSWNSKFWQRPEIARLLAPVSTGQSEIGSAPRSVAELVSGIQMLSADLDRLDRVLAVEVSASARELGAMIAKFDREIADAATALDPTELERLKERLSALGAPRDAEPRGTAQLRRLLREQLALLDDLAERRKAFEDRRERALEHLRTLWLQLGAIRAQGTLEAAAESEITARFRLVCAEVSVLSRASGEVRSLTGG